MARTIGSLGWVRDLPDPRDHLFSVPLKTLQSLPAKVDLGSAFPVYDQKEIGSCTANALAAAVQFDRIKDALDPAFIPSRLFIYYNERSLEGDVPLDKGAQIRDGVKTLQQQGVCPEDMWPYIPTTPPYEGGPFPVGSAPVTRPPQQCYDTAINYTISSYQSLTQSLSQLQGCLASGYPFVFGFTVFKSWWESESTIMGMPASDDSVVGGHAVLCTGYDNDTQLFKFRNSWGPELGENGYFYMPYAYMTSPDLADDFWVINATKD